MIVYTTSVGLSNLRKREGSQNFALVDALRLVNAGLVPSRADLYFLTRNKQCCFALANIPLRI